MQPSILHSTEWSLDCEDFTMCLTLVWRVRARWLSGLCVAVRGGAGCAAAARSRGHLEHEG